MVYLYNNFYLLYLLKSYPYSYLRLERTIIKFVQFVVISRYKLPDVWLPY